MSLIINKTAINGNCVIKIEKTEIKNKYEFVESGFLFYLIGGETLFIKDSAQITEETSDYNYCMFKYIGHLSLKTLMCHLLDDKKSLVFKDE